MAMDLQAVLKLTDSFTSPLRNAVRALDNVERAASQIDRNFTDMTRSVQQAAEQMNTIGNNANNSTADISRLERELEDMRQELANASGNADDLENNLDQAGSTGSGAADKIGGAFKVVAGVLAAAFAVDKIKDFATGAIEAAAEASATSAQYSEVFGDLEGEATEKLDAIGKESSILSNRMKGSFTKMAAFAKVGGMDTAESLDLADRSMRAVADGAAFYDRSLEDTTESLQSFLKGNFANDAALGLSATETTRNAAANDLYGKSYKDLDEAQKQLTLLQMVEDANEVSGAMGQAARESDGWENVMGNMKQAWTDFQAVLGVPLLDIATKGIKWATDTLQNIDTQGIADKIGGVFSFIGDKITASIDTIERFRTFFGALKDIMSGENETTDNIFWAWGMDPASFGPITTGLETIRTVFGALRDIMSGEQETASNIFAAWGLSPEVWAPMTNGIEAVRTVFGYFSEILKTVFEFFQSMIPPAIQIFQDLWAILQPIFQSLSIALRVVGDVIKTVFVDVAMPIIKLVWSLFQTLWDIIRPILLLLAISIQVTFGWLEWVWEKIVKPVVKYIGDSITSLNKTLEPILEGISGFFRGLGDTIENALGKVNEFVDSLKSVKVPEWISDMGGAIVDVFTPGQVGVDGSHYRGLASVPYDGYTARLHKGERVLDRDEAKRYNSGSSGGANVTVTGNTFHVRKESDIDDIANRLAAKILEAGELGA